MKFFNLYFCISLQAVLLLILLFILPRPIWEHLYPKSETSTTEGISPLLLVDYEIEDYEIKAPMKSVNETNSFQKTKSRFSTLTIANSDTSTKVISTVLTKTVHPSFTHDRKTTSVTKKNFPTTEKNILTSKELPLQTQPARSTSPWKVQSVTLVKRTTAMLLKAKSFTSEPEWDIEEDYTLAASASETSCPISVKIKAQNSSWLKEKFLPKITIFMDNHHINKREWVRLQHFVPPYGWMELNYTVLHQVISALPRIPDQQLLLAEKNEDKFPRCVSCAVVGNGGILNASGLGREIDEHDYVFRVNGAVIKGYEKDVGVRTSFYGFTAFTMLASLSLLHEKGFPKIPQDKETKYILFTEGRRDYEWLKALQQNKNISKGTLETYRLHPRDDFGNNFDFKRLLVAYPDFVRYLKNRFLRSLNLNEKYWSIYRPSTGALVLLTALHLCDTSWFHVLIVSFCSDVAVILLCSGHFMVVCYLMTTVLGASIFVFRTITFYGSIQHRGRKTCKTKLKLQVSAYGFITHDYKSYSDHYYDKEKTEVILYINHDFLLEKDLWAQLHRENIIKLYQRT